jgi:hypothetical protein
MHCPIAYYNLRSLRQIPWSHLSSYHKSPSLGVLVPYHFAGRLKTASSFDFCLCSSLILFSMALLIFLPRTTWTWIISSSFCLFLEPHLQDFYFHLLDQSLELARAPLFNSTASGLTTWLAM